MLIQRRKDNRVVGSQMESYFDEDKSYMDSYYKFDVPSCFMLNVEYKLNIKPKK